MTDVENYIYQFEGEQREIMLYLHDLLVKELDLFEKIRYKIPFYYGKSWICYVNPIKGEKVELAFIRGNELSNHQGILESKGRKQVYGIDLEKRSEIPHKLINEILQEAILLDEVKPYASKRKSKKP